MEMDAREPCCSAANDVPDLRPAEGDAVDEELAGLAKTLAHPVRVQILRLLVRRESCVCGEIVLSLPLAQLRLGTSLKNRFFQSRRRQK